MKKSIPLILIMALVLAACGSTGQASSGSITSQPTQPAQPTEAKQATAPPAQQPAAASDNQVRTDSQGAVEVTVTPLNLDQPGESLEFEVGLNTHSVDLSMDLASVSTLTTDTGLSIQGSAWDAQRGGHHVGGKLIFPATVDGKPVLQGAKKLTLTVKNVDAPQRIFTWDLQ